ncbi:MULTISPECIES: type II toxin-antitoxin system VapC family toxin [Rhizobium]|uniref:type II toxin-antitoxin system VapC family toxin n=1 Tax=Rhizobium TaxID=379 RepID=UPI0007EA02D8|nr:MULTISPECIES: type II toxin-antitoxin system VapC family toxin [Rhizobium]ANK92473.1 PilT domain-containing protein [Rhizobium sp. N6212]ANL10705.1 PilT domain-containing protein [Rhizobium sp. N1341]ANL22757.1 PilT domain-containing protein [Rhizobium sp. N113]ANM41548.1 PilT domain-containing protein [Rhizobium sp. N741]ANK86557.1 PilT domain-containing protein [Rhizobium sp. N731]
MNSLLLDTHAWAWSLTGDKRLSAKAIALIEKAETILVSPISLFEIGQKVRVGKWPEMQPFVGRLPDLLQEQGAIAAALTPDVCLAAAMMDWAHRDPFDRFLAATAMENGIPIISADTIFDELAGNQLWIARFW